MEEMEYSSGEINRIVFLSSVPALGLPMDEGNQNL